MTLHGASPWYRARPGVTLCSCEHNPPRGEPVVSSSAPSVTLCSCEHNPPRGEPAVSIPGKSESLKALAPFRFKLRVRSVSATPSIRYRVTHTVPRRTECQRFLLPKQSNQKYSLPNQQAAETAPPEAVLTRIITAGLANQAVYVAAKLGIADLLADGPKILHPSSGIVLSVPRSSSSNRGSLRKFSRCGSTRTNVKPTACSRSACESHRKALSRSLSHE